jgi:hypothetical protein|tara:strand:+ start:1694 stop:1975 length:282 start_codon:yes stop_codon:yes gene_type:complete
MKTFHLELETGVGFTIDADKYRIAPTGMLEMIRFKTEEAPEDIVFVVQKERVLYLGVPDPITKYRLPNPPSKQPEPEATEGESVSPDDDAGSS